MTTEQKVQQAIEEILRQNALVIRMNGMIVECLLNQPQVVMSSENFNQMMK